MATKLLHSRNTEFTLNSEYRMTTHKKNMSNASKNYYPGKVSKDKK